MVASVLGVVVLVLSVPVGVLALVCLGHLPFRGTDDPKGTARKCLLAGGALGLAATVFSLLAELAAILVGQRSGGVLGPLAYLVLDCAIGLDVCHMLYDLSSFSDGAEARRRALILMALAGLFVVCQVAEGVAQSAVAPSILLLLGLADLALLRRTSAPASEGASPERRGGASHEL
jgi:hypothetical protein